MVMKYGLAPLMVLGLVSCGSPPAASRPVAPKQIEGMWSDLPTAVGMLCFFTCTDVAIERLNALLDDPANDARPFTELRAEADRHARETYIRPRLTDVTLKSYPLDPADDPGLLR